MQKSPSAKLVEQTADNGELPVFGSVEPNADLYSDNSKYNDDLQIVSFRNFKWTYLSVYNKYLIILL